MSEAKEEFAIALKELQQVSETIVQGANYFDSQVQQGQQIAGYAVARPTSCIRCTLAVTALTVADMLDHCSVTESTKGYIKEVLQATTQHLLNVADIVDGAIVDQTAAVCQLDTASKNILQVDHSQG